VKTLTDVHVNRTIKALYKRKRIARSGEAITLTNSDLLKAIAEFSSDLSTPVSAENFWSGVYWAHVRTPAA
jgi:hypothetical protein